MTYAAQSVTLVVNLGTGILIARSLGAAGRGELTAILAVTQMAGFLFAVGCAQAVAFHQSRHPADAPRLLGSWVALLVPLACLAFAFSQVLLPVLFGAQTEATVSLARWFLLLIFTELAYELASGMILGEQRFTLFNAFRVAVPSLVAICLVLLWLTDELSVGTALLAHAVANTLLTGSLLAHLLWRHGIAAPSRRLLLATFSYGARAHGNSVGGTLNARLDLAIIPALVAASVVGLYSVATNLSLIVVTLAGSLGQIVLPAAARQSGERAARTVVLALHATLGIGALLGLGLELVADVGIRLVYGDAFSGAAPALRILVPGAVLYAAATVLVSGLYALNRPFTAAVAQVLGLVVTVAGLLVFLRAGGTEAAALVSTVSYTVVFGTALLLYRRAARLPWRSFVPGFARPAAPGTSAGSGR